MIKSHPPNVAKNEIFYNQIWELPKSITIKNNLRLLNGDSWLAKINNLFIECDISPNLINNAQRISENEIKICFSSHYIRNIIKIIVTPYICKSFNNKILIE